jgi:hypothetical protein
MATVDEMMVAALIQVIGVLSDSPTQFDYSKQGNKLNELEEHVNDLSHPIPGDELSTTTIALPTTREEVVTTLREVKDMVLSMPNPTQKAEMLLVLKRCAELLRADAR